mmetsp:Transcript_66208/g.127978  ORF Transcript_66208/g.127978 Transcript_66208/m.127978 type:complete len:259 (-) Transcript_66208:1174-1950(-)
MGVPSCTLWLSVIAVVFTTIKKTRIKCEKSWAESVLFFLLLSSHMKRNAFANVSAENSRDSTTSRSTSSASSTLIFFLLPAGSIMATVSSGATNPSDDITLSSSDSPTDSRLLQSFAGISCIACPRSSVDGKTVRISVPSSVPSSLLLKSSSKSFKSMSLSALSKKETNSCSSISPFPSVSNWANSTSTVISRVFMLYRTMLRTAFRKRWSSAFCLSGSCPRKCCDRLEARMRRVSRRPSCSSRFLVSTLTNALKSSL